MTSQNKAALQREFAARVLARRNLLYFTKRTHPNYQAGWVHEDICRRLEKFSRDVAEKKGPRLMLLVPPRHGKSEIASIRFPAWHLGHHPDHEIINCGYNTDLPMKFSRRVRELLRDKGYHAMFSDTKLDPDSQSVEAWNTLAGGGFTAAGVGGGITGKGAHILIIDDPIKNMEEADSPVTRETLWDWYWSTAYTRLAPGGGVLVIQCMTGDTPVLMADGSERRLDQITSGDVVATYEHGALSVAKVRGVKASGRDSVLKITTKSGKIVRANGRHPFLTDIGGDLKWMRARSLTTDHRIVALKDSETSGKELRAQLTGATSSRLKTELARFVVRSHQKTRIIGKSDLAEAEDCSATTATQESDILDLSPWHLPLHNTSDFILDPVVSIEPDGVEEVFDLQVERTENFIANGLVSHNTWWNDDDLAGRLQKKMRDEPDSDQFVIIKYPALAEADEYEAPDGLIYRVDPDDKLAETPPEGSRLLRPKGEALHLERYPTKVMENYRANMHPRIWSALYQQNPVPDEGMYFKDEWFRTEPTPPAIRKRNLFQAWDFAIGEKQQNDFTVGVTLMQDENNFLHVLDLVKFKGDTFVIIEEILNSVEKWSLYPDTPLTIGFEDGQIWRAIEPVLKMRMAERNIFPPYEVLKPLTDKLVRARALQGRMQQGRVMFLDTATWYDGLKREMMRFPAGAHDDQCFTLDTKIIMSDGRESDIISVREGDYVHTPSGPQIVLKSEMTSVASEVFEVSFSDGSVLCGTKDHPVYVQDLGAFVSISALQPGDLVCTLRKRSTEASHTVAIRSARTRLFAGIFTESAVGLTKHFIGECGRMLTAPSRSVMSFITKIVTQVITASRILSVFPQLSTELRTEHPPLRKDKNPGYASGRSQQNTLVCSAGLSLSRIRQTVPSSAAISAVIDSTAEVRKTSFAVFVGRHLRRLRVKFRALASVVKSTSADESLIGTRSDTHLHPGNLKLVSVWCADRVSQPLHLAPALVPSLVHTKESCSVSVLSVRRRDKLEAVYNLRVGENPVFYANGILVHNCDALAWACNLIVNKQPPQGINVQPKLKSWKDKINSYGMGDVSHMAA